MRIFGALLVLLFGASGALSAELNCQQIRLITPYPPGGAADVASRLLAERLEPALKKPIIIENRPGATGNIGTDRKSTRLNSSHSQQSRMPSSA